MSHEQVDTRVTAYVFGELSPQETAAFERELAQSSQLRDEVATISETIGALRSEFESRVSSVGDSQRQAIERAIGQRASVDPVSLDDSTATSNRRLAIVAVLAASVLIICSLAYPYVTSPTATSISMRENARPEIAVLEPVEGNAATAADVDEELAETVDMFHRDAKELGDEQAQSGSGRVNKKQPEDATAITRLHTRQLGQQLTESNHESRDEKSAAPTSEPELPNLALPVLELSGTTVQVPKSKSIPKRRRIAVGEDKALDGVDDDLAPAGDRISNRSSVDLQWMDSDSKSPPERLSELKRKFSDESDSIRPAKTGAIIEEETEAEESLPFGTATGGASYGDLAIGLDDGAKIAKGSGLQVDNGRSSAGSLRGGYGLPKDTTDIRVEETQIKGRPIAAQVTDMLEILEKDVAGETEGKIPRRRTRRRGGLGMDMESMEDMDGIEMDMDMDEMEDMMAMEFSVKEEDGFSLAMSGARKTRALGTKIEMERQMSTEAIIASPLGDRFEPIEDNPFVDVTASPLSTFSIDVDTASYAKVRALLNQNSLPRPDAVRIEELLNYFNYDYAPPQDDHPFAASMDIAACPWNSKHRLARIGIKGKVIEDARPSSNLVFLLDVSGSMDEPKKLPLVIQGMKMLTDQLTENDKVGIVVYAGAAGLVLDSTRGDKKQQIVAALDRLKAGGSTNGGQGILLAYGLARDNFIVGGTNRVILCSDGDFNVGVTGTDQLVKIAQDNAKSNIFLSVLGFGIGNHNDAMMEQISNKGNGNYAFIDSKSEAEKVLVEELGSTLVTIAKDVKIQIEFNPKQVASYRLIGYENRVLKAQDFNDDKKDAGEIGAGHTVTALYEIVPADVDDANVPATDDLRYQKRTRLSKDAESGETLVLKLRYKQPEGDTSTLIKFPVTDSGKQFSKADRDFQFAASVAAFGMLLRNSPHKGDATFDAVVEIAGAAAQDDQGGYRKEFLSLVAKAKQLRGE